MDSIILAILFLIILIAGARKREVRKTRRQIRKYYKKVEKERRRAEEDAYEDMLMYYEAFHDD